MFHDAAPGSTDNSRHACSTEAASTSGTSSMDWKQNLLIDAAEKLVRFPPLFEQARISARKRIRDVRLTLHVCLQIYRSFAQSCP